MCACRTAYCPRLEFSFLLVYNFCWRVSRVIARAPCGCGRKVRTPRVHPEGEPRRAACSPNLPTGRNEGRSRLPHRPGTESAAENRPPRACLPACLQAGLSPETDASRVAPGTTLAARVKRWGKSPPLRQRCRRHGKPRAEQDQIGEEGWPGPWPDFGWVVTPG